MKPGECILIGSIGIAEFSLVVIFGLISFKFAKNHYVRMCFASMVISATLELPRYISLVVLRAYNSLPTYACHVLSTIFLYWTLSFLSVALEDALSFSGAHRQSRTAERVQRMAATQFSTVDRLVGRAAELLRNSSLLQRILTGFNFVFDTMDITCAICLLTYRSFDASRSSTIFVVYSFVDAIFYVVLTLFIYWHASKLRKTLVEFAIRSEASQGVRSEVK